jgi:hypothetical protein
MKRNVGEPRPGNGHHLIFDEVKLQIPNTQPKARNTEVGPWQLSETEKINVERSSLVDISAHDRNV